MTEEHELRTTIVIPAWDAYAGTRLQQALASIAAQQAPDVRVLVVDNASQRPLSVSGHAESVRTPTRLTLGAARNAGLDCVQTRYVVFWDADDLMLPGTLELLEAAIESDPRLVAFGMAIQESPSGLRHRWPRRRLKWLVKAPGALALVDCIWSQFPTTGATIMRTEAARAGGGYADADSGDDWCLGVSLAFRGRVGWSEQLGRVYRLHPDSVWARHLTVAHQRRHAKAVRARIREDPGIPGWARALLPLIWLGQHAALAAHAAVAERRRRRGGGWGSA